MKIMTLMDNLPGAQKSLQAEHGLSFFVETEHVKILFDFGSGIHTLENAAKLNVKLSQIDYSAGSHGHYDHAGGYPFFAEAGLTCPLVTGRGYFEEKYALSGRKAAFLGAGFDESFLAGKHIPHIQCRDILPLAEGCWALGASNAPGNLKPSRNGSLSEERRNGFRISLRMKSVWRWRRRAG